MNLLSIQSHVTYGHVGNSAAMFALQRLGCEVWPIHTVQFSNHPGYGAFRGTAVDAALVGDIVTGLAEQGVLASCDGVLSGYMGTAEIGAAILDAVARVKAANPNARYCCDPVIGDVGPGVYVRPGIVELLKQHAVPAADVLTPNQFELEQLTSHSVTTVAKARAAIAALRARGPRAVLVTSLRTEQTPADCIDVIACDPDGAFRVRTPRLDSTANGAGDAIAALFFAHYLRTNSAADAASRAVSSVFGILRRTAAAGAREMLLIEAQDELIAPSKIFSAEPV